MSENQQYKRFGALNVLLVDPNHSNAQKTREMLSSLGVYQIRMARDSKEMMDHLAETTIDVITYDMGSKASKAIDPILQLRDYSNMASLTPVLAFSRETTLQDVRDMVNAGVTEIIGQPASVKSVFSRFQHIVDSPRSFLATNQFKGPDRRRKSKPDLSAEVRAARSPQIVTREQYFSGTIDGPMVMMPDFKLKAKVSNLVAGALPTNVEDEFIFRVLLDVDALEASHIALSQGASAASNIERICNACLSIEARSEAYGYTLGCIIARSLSTFCRDYYVEGKPAHLVIIEKHFQTLSTIYHGRLKGDGGEQGKALASDLGLLIKKYTSV